MEAVSKILSEHDARRKLFNGHRASERPGVNQCQRGSKCTGKKENLCIRYG